MLCIPVIAAAAAGSFLYGQCNCCEFKVGNVDFNRQCWMGNPLCLSRKQYLLAQCMADKGRKCWRTDPVSAAANFLNNDFICDEYRCTPATVCEVKICCNKAYVVLSFNDCSKMAFELYQPAKQGCGGVWYVRKYAYV